MRKWLEPLATAWVGMASHKLRSSLTILGVVIGVAAVITLMSIGKGTEATIMSRIQNLGSNLIFVRPGATTQFGVRTASGSAATLTMEDAAAIAAQISNVAYVVPSNSTSQQLVTVGQNMNAQVIGTTTDYKAAYNLQMADGTFFSEDDYRNGARIAVLGSNVKQTLFPSDNPVGQTLRVGSGIVQIAGVLQSKGASMGVSPDDAVVIPLTALQQMFSQRRTARGERVVNSVAVVVTNTNQASSVVDQITSLLRTRHQLAAN
ncbi:MAG: ABC transporter permease, partial [Chloroflexota bacterium]